MTKVILDIPKNEVAEVTLIGTGGGYGESVVIHLGNQNWMVVDSCINPETRKSLPLEYLESLKVDLDNVILIVCTHWHDDHILGLSQLLESCPQAYFSSARANDIQKFMRFIALDLEKVATTASASSTKEFNKCLDIINSRTKKLKAASIDRTLLSLQLNSTIKSEVFSLSPSDFTNQKFDIELGDYIKNQMQSNRKILSYSPNARSVVLYLKLGSHRIILGADLEISIDKNEGWVNILDNSEVIERGQNTSFFKIPHHGSANGYHVRVWDELMSKDSTTTLTPWNKKNKLPKNDMLKLYCNHSEKVYMTTAAVNKYEKPKKRNKYMSLQIEKFNRTLKEVRFEKGIIRCRIDLNAQHNNWDVNLIDSAIHVNPLMS